MDDGEGRAPHVSLISRPSPWCKRISYEIPTTSKHFALHAGGLVLRNGKGFYSSDASKPSAVGTPLQLIRWLVDSLMMNETGRMWSMQLAYQGCWVSALWRQTRNYRNLEWRYGWHTMWTMKDRVSNLAEMAKYQMHGMPTSVRVVLEAPTDTLNLLRSEVSTQPQFVFSMNDWMFVSEGKKSRTLHSKHRKRQEEANVLGRPRRTSTVGKG